MWADLERGIRTSVHNNVSAYGFSVMITASFGVIAAPLGSPDVGAVFLYVAGSVSGVVLIEGAATKGFKVKLRGEPSDVVSLGAAFGFISVGLAVGAAALTAQIISHQSAWLIGPFLASLIYVTASGLEMTLAHKAQKRREEEEESDQN